MTYATDGKCHNSEPGTYGHECSKPANWIGTKSNGHRCGFCDDCRRHGYEARHYGQWTPYEASLQAAEAGAYTLTHTPNQPATTGAQIKLF